MGRVVKVPGHVVRAAALEDREALAAARNDAEAIRAEARRAGYAEGRAEAAAEAAALLSGARAEQTRAVNDAAPVAAALAAKMAERIVGHVVTVAPAAMAEIVATAVEASRPREAAVTVRLHPDDLPAVETRRDTLAARAPAASEIALVADDSVGRYGCVVETPHGRVDARLETQLEALEQAICGAAKVNR